MSAVRLARWTGRRRRPLAVAWLLAVLGAALVAQSLPGMLSGGGWSVSGSQSAAVNDALREGFAGRGASTVTVVLRDSWYASDQPAFAKRMAAAAEAVAAEPELAVESRYGWSTVGAAARGEFVGEDGRTVVDVLGLALEDGRARQVLPEVQEHLTETYAERGLQVSLVGAASFWGEVNELSERGLARAELLTLPLVLLVLLLLFKGLAPALSAMAVGVSSILFSFAVLAVVARSHELSVFVTNTATMLGLGVGVDYSLFMIARFQEELRHGRSTDDAVAVTLRTSGETVLASGVTVIAAMSCLFLVPLGVIASIALGAVVVVASSVLTSVLLLPVLLHALAPRLRRHASRREAAHGPRRGARWEVLAGRVMRRPVLSLVLGLGVVLLLALPSLRLSTFTPDARILPSSSPVRAGYDHMQESFGVGSTSPVVVVVSGRDPLAGREVAGRLAALQDELRALSGVERVDSAVDLLLAQPGDDPLALLTGGRQAALPPEARAVLQRYASEDGRRLVLEVVPTSRASDRGATDLLAATRAAAERVATPSLAVAVGGETAEGVDANALIQSRMPWVVLAMLATIFLLLLLTFRSLLLPLKAMVLNLLSVAATYGVLVVVFQDGWGASLLGVDSPGPIANFVPVLLLALLFSLSTDYEVFLLSRVRERYLQTGDNRSSVQGALAQTAPLISGAALLMVVVFGAFAFAGILPIKELGLGMAVAIALDATLVRLVLVPASMTLAGRWNWWLPLRRAQPGQRVPDAAPEAQPVAGALLVLSTPSPFSTDHQVPPSAPGSAAGRVGATAGRVAAEAR